ncbi:MAG: aldehyde dehydrogenase family protein [Janthinobacterium lividum]
MISSIFTGNGIVVKASEQTAWSAQYFTAIVRGALTACGHSPNLVQSIACWPSVAPHLTSHPGISHITFIGSRPVAHHVAASAAKSLTPVCVELGGKDAAIILDDVKNFEKVSSILMRGVFQSAGQNCIGIERVVAMPKAYERLLQILTPRIRALRVGSALDDEEEVDVGACISPANFDNLERLIQDAVSRGAQLLCGGSRYEHPKYSKGHYFAPTLLAGVTPDMPIAQQELFAPIFVLLKATSVDDAISIANSTPYALGASVFGSRAADLEKVTREVKVGMLSVNDFASYYMCSLPFGGVKGSGYGRFGGAEGLRSLCNTKSVNRDRFWGLISTAIPPRLDYVAEKVAAKGVRNAKAKAWEFAKGIVELGYGQSLGGRMKGLGKLVRHG